MPALNYDGVAETIIASRCVESVVRTGVGVYEIVLAYPQRADSWAADVTLGDALATATPGEGGRWTIRTYELPETPADEPFIAHWFPGTRETD